MLPCYYWLNSDDLKRAGWAATPALMYEGWYYSLARRSMRSLDDILAKPPWLPHEHLGPLQAHVVGPFNTLLDALQHLYTPYVAHFTIDELTQHGAPPSHALDYAGWYLSADGYPIAHRIKAMCLRLNHTTIAHYVSSGALLGPFSTFSTALDKFDEIQIGGDIDVTQNP